MITPREILDNNKEYKGLKQRLEMQIDNTLREADVMSSSAVRFYFPENVPHRLKYQLLRDYKDVGWSCTINEISDFMEFLI